MTDIKKRRRFPIVNRSRQYGFLAVILIYLFIIVVFLGAFIVVPDFIQMQDESLSLETRAAIANKILYTHSILWPTVISLVCIIGLHSFRVFHRFVGPLYRFCWAFEQVKNGNLSFQVTLRKGDYLNTEKEAFNKMIEMLGKKIKTTQLASLDALNSLDELERKVTDMNNCREDAKEPFLVLHQHLDTLSDAAGYFILQKTEKKTGSRYNRPFSFQAGIWGDNDKPIKAFDTR